MNKHLCGAVAALACLALAGPASAQEAGRTITVTGSAAKKTPESLGAAGQRAAYFEALGLAQDAALAKAQALAAHAGGSVGPVQSITELTDFVFGYCGYSTSAGGSDTPSVGGGGSTPISNAHTLRRRKRPRKPPHSAAAAATCPVGAIVVVTYSL